jgi:glycosyltransferase involved in cell wall biosynthesis
MMRLNWFSPLPPEQTDIAHYTGRLAAALMRRFDVVFWTDLRSDSAVLPSGAKVKVFNPAHIAGREFNLDQFEGLNIYNFGNDARFHAGIYRVAQKIPGIAILHDTVLHHFFYELSRNDSPPFAEYIDLARQIYGFLGKDQARSIVASDGRLIDEFATKMPFIEAVTENAIGAICHSKAAGNDLSAYTDTPVLTLPLPFTSSLLRANEDRTWHKPWRLITFGYINTNRRLESILFALGGMPKSYDFTMDIYGVLWDTPLIEAAIAENGLSERVRIHGFVSEERLNKVIASAHLSFNLRYPTMGEASGGILRSWALGTPALVTDGGWYSDLPASVAYKISVENEVSDIQAALLRLEDAPEEFERMGLAAHSWLKGIHSPEDYVNTLCEAFVELPKLLTRFTAHRVLLRAALKGGSRKERDMLLDRAAAQIPALFEEPRQPRSA